MWMMMLWTLKRAPHLCTIAAICLIGRSRQVGAVEIEDARKNNLRLSHAYDPRKAHRDRLREETENHLRESGHQFHPDYDRRRKLVDVNASPGGRKTTKLNAKVGLSSYYGDDAAFWDRMLQNGDNSMPPTKSPIKAPTPFPSTIPTRSPVDEPTKAPNRAPTPEPTPAPTRSPSQRPTRSPIKIPTPEPTDEPTPRPVPAPTSPPDVRSIIEEIALFGGDEFEDPESHQSKALDWLETSSTAGLSNAKIIQRYALASIYFATNQVMTVFTEMAFDGDIMPWLRRNGWLTDSDECEWANIMCLENGFVQMLDLFGNLVTGEFPPEVVLLSEWLQVLDVGQNVVFTRGDNFNVYLGQLTELTDLRYENTNFINNGGIPVEIGNLKKLAFYNCASTRYVGALDSNAFPSDMTELTHLEIEYNAYFSNVPRSIGQLPSLKYLYLRESFLEGNLDFMLPMRAIEELWVDTNVGLGGGPLPTFLGDISTLASFSVSESGYTGALPTELGQLDSMQQLWLSSNEFTGVAGPPEWASLGRLDRLEIQQNSLDGIILEDLCVDMMGETLKADCVNCPTDIVCCSSCFDENGVEMELV